MADAHARTFEWIFDRAAEKSGNDPEFIEWLLSSDQSLYWITGKAGSGKSTLMKFILSHPKTRKILQIWAKDKKLILASHFFWNPGTDKQKSQEGLLQTLLHDIFEQWPDIVEKCLPDSLKTYFDADILIGKDSRTWTRSELLNAFSLLKDQPSDSAAICLFIDGLDEYHSAGLDQYRDLIQVISSLTKTNYVKICVSSRPWSIFEDAFNKLASGKLSLHQLTAKDMGIFIKDSLEADARFRELQRGDSQYVDLVREIRDRAEGVFLWVFLVVRSLLQGLANEDTITVLRKRLRELPPDLEDLFRHMLQKTERVYREDACQIFQVCLSNKSLARDNPLMLLLFLLEPETSFEEVIKSQDWTPEATETKCNILTKRVEARCRDLLEVSCKNRSQGVLYEFSVEFLHRTVADFLEQNDLRNILFLREASPFEPDLYTCRACLALLCMTKEDFRSQDGVFDLLTTHLSKADRCENSANNAKHLDLIRKCKEKHSPLAQVLTRVLERRRDFESGTLDFGAFPTLLEKLS